MLPFGPVKRLASPGGSRVLYGVPYQRGIGKGPELWIEDTHTQQRTMLLPIDGTMDGKWSSDGTAFSINDRLASDSTLSYIYDARTLQRMDIANQIRTSDPETDRFANAHIYFVVDRWEGTQDVIVHLYGHTDNPPVVCFDLRYRVNRTGFVQKLSEHISPVTAQGCEQ